MIDTPEVSRETIIKKYDLPERQAKINTILKMQTQAPLYCRCRSADINNRFMIMCDKCGEWFHGDCIGMKEKDSKIFEKWFCYDCIKVYGLKIKYNIYNSSLKKKKIKKRTLFNRVWYGVDNENSQCGKCSNCLQNEECGNRNFKFPTKHCITDRKKAQIDANSRNINIQSNDTQLVDTITKRFKRVREPLRELVCCFGPGCSKRPRPNSKYCGDECGLALAKQRLVTVNNLWCEKIDENICFQKPLLDEGLTGGFSNKGIVPVRITKTPCKAEQIDRIKLYNIRLQQKITAQKLEKIYCKEMELHKLLETANKLPIVDNGCNVEIQHRKIDCIICGQKIPLESSKRHWELCFKKMEEQFEDFVIYENNKASSKIFCNFYDAKNKTYCEYLRSICPDHMKPRKIPENEVCGCPIVNSVSVDMFSNTDSFCQQLKQKCDLHYNWENAALAEIDFEHLKEINKMNQLVQEKAIILQNLNNRLGVLGILLNSTTPNCK